MKRILIFAIVAVLLVSTVSAVLISTTILPANKDNEFYVGVTFCGNNTADAKLLVDKVSDYTNLFVLQSGPLLWNNTAIIEIGNYAVAKGLHFAAYFDPTQPVQNADWLGNATKHWGDMFVGVYYGDEPGGKMLDTNIDLTDRSTLTSTNGTGITFNTFSNQNLLVKLASGGLQTSDGTFFPNGTITVQKFNDTFSSEPDPNNSSITISSTLSNTNLTTYEPNGSITVRETIAISTNKVYTGGSPFGHYGVGDSYQVLSDNFYTMENGSDRIAREETYQQVKSKNPIPNCNVAADLYVDRNGKPIEALSSQWQLGNRSFPIFTADYALYWWDYQCGYDMMLAELGWNNTVAQEIALVRGAANLQGKDWGTIITWKYMQPPYLGDGDEMFEQLRASYECGAKYAIVFNYAEDMNATYGILQEEHFEALERFWKEVVQNPYAGYGSVKAEAAVVLPRNFGWGMRHSTDKIWGLWEANSTTQQVWTVVQAKLAEYGAKLDIVYEDPAYPVAGKYSQVIYWNQTG